MTRDSPCIGVCTTLFDPVCRGCGRTDEEVAQWATYTPERKAAIMRRLNLKGVMTFQEFQANVERWATERGIYEHSTLHAQTLKAASEMGELCDAIAKGDMEAAIDGIGDTLVTLVNVAYMRGVSMEECMSAAWGAIKDRKGRMSPSGAWIKEE